MSDSKINTVIKCQAALTEALDNRDPGAITDASKALANALAAVRSTVENANEAQELEYAFKQSTALKIRINTLSEWNRQQIDRLKDLRGIPVDMTYGKSKISFVK